MNINFSQSYNAHYQEAAKGLLSDTEIQDLPDEFNSAAFEKAGKAKELVRRMQQIRAADTKVYQAARAVGAFAWVVVTATSLVTVAPAIAYTATTSILGRDPLNLPHRLSLKSEEQLQLEEEWDKMRKEWKEHPLQNPYDLFKAKDWHVISSAASKTSERDCSATFDQLNRIFNSTLEEVQNLPTFDLGEGRVSTLFTSSINR